MRLILLTLFASAVSFGQAVVSNIYFTDISHSSAHTHFNVSVPWTNMRIRWSRVSDGHCSGGTGGTILPSDYPRYGNSSFRPVGGAANGNPDFATILQGLPYPNTDYYVCPEVANNPNNGGEASDPNGTGSYSTGAEALLHTAPLPAVHPAEPVAPTIYSPVYPDTTTYHKIHLDSNCYVASGNAPVGQALYDALNDATAHQADYGTVIYGAPGSRCQQYIEFHNSSQNVTTFNSNQVSMTDSSITFNSGQIAQIMSPGGGTLTEGLALRFSSNYSGLPGTGGPGDWPTLEDPAKCTGIAQGVLYYVHLPNSGDPTHVQLTCNARYGQNMPDGTPYKLMVFANAGGGNNLYVQKSPSGLNWVIMDVDLPDSQFAARGTRITPDWQSKMPAVVLTFAGGNYGGRPYTGNTPSNAQAISFSTDSADFNEGHTVSNLWIRGWMFTTIDDLDSDTSTDPDKFEYLFKTTTHSAEIVLDQVYFHGQGGPHRIHRPIPSWDGHNLAMINSRMDNMELFVSNYTGLQVSTLSGTSFKIGHGRHGLNASGRWDLDNDVTVNLTTGSATGSFYAYVGLVDRKLHIAMPPGVTGTCSPAVCTMDVLQVQGNGVYHVDSSGAAGSPGYPNSIVGGALYWVDPQFNAVSSAIGARGLLDNVPDPSKSDSTAAAQFSASPIELGTTFIARANGFIPSVRFYKPPQDTDTSHTVTLWNSSGTVVAQITTSGESASGWQTANFATIPAVTNGQQYTVSYFSNRGVYYAYGWYQNASWINNNMEAPGYFVDGSGGCDTNRQWPKNWAGHTRVGQIACGHLASGSINSLDNATVRINNYGIIDLSGSNAIIGGRGPGPWLAVNNYLSLTGNGLHHDEGGINFDNAGTRYATPFFTRGDYWYKRNYFEAPLTHMAAQPPPDIAPGDVWKGARNPDYDDAYDPALYALSNGAYYESRQPFEFKSGHRIHIEGNIFGSTFNNTASSIFVALTSVVDEGIMDVSLTNNTFQHGAGVMVLSATQNPMQTRPVKRFRFSNNLAWDLRASYFSPGGPQGPGTGYIIEIWGQEDAIIDHNTIFFNKGRAPSLTLADYQTEGVKVTNNILFATSSNGGFGFRADPSGVMTGPQTCNLSGSNGQPLADCIMVGASTWNKNVIFSDVDNATLAGKWDSNRNYLPATPNNMLFAKFWNIKGAWDPSYASNFNAPATPSAHPDFHLRNDSCFISGATNSICGGTAYVGTDGKDIGADMDALEDAQGKVTLTSAVTAPTSATINFTTSSDAGPCSVDYSATDPTLINAFTRTQGTNGGKVQSVTLTGLTSNKVYNYRVNCQTTQPTGVFITR